MKVKRIAFLMVLALAIITTIGVSSSPTSVAATSANGCRYAVFTGVSNLGEVAVCNVHDGQPGNVYASLNTARLGFLKICFNDPDGQKHCSGSNGVGTDFSAGGCATVSYVASITSQDRDPMSVEFQDAVGNTITAATLKTSGSKSVHNKLRTCFGG